MLAIILSALVCGGLAYLIGSLSFSIIVSKFLYHDDIRNYGSGNAGMTNVLRTYGKKAAALTIIGDIGKGTVAVCIARVLFAALTSAMSNPMPGEYGCYIAAFCAVMGHLYPVYFGFKGGKGVSVAAGTIVAIYPVLLLALLVVFFTVVLTSKMVSLASIFSAISYPIFTFLYCLYLGQPPLVYTVLASVMGALVVWMHRSNITRILNGTEYKFGQKKVK